MDIDTGNKINGWLFNKTLGLSGDLPSAMSPALAAEFFTTERYNNYSYVKWYVHGDKQLSTLGACQNFLRNVKNVKYADASEFLI